MFYPFITHTAVRREFPADSHLARYPISTSLANTSTIASKHYKRRSAESGAALRSTTLIQRGLQHDGPSTLEKRSGDTLLIVQYCDHYVYLTCCERTYARVLQRKGGSGDASYLRQNGRKTPAPFMLLRKHRSRRYHISGTLKPKSTRAIPVILGSSVPS